MATRGEVRLDVEIDGTGADATLADLARVNKAILANIESVKASTGAVARFADTWGKATIAFGALKAAASEAWAALKAGEAALNMQRAFAGAVRESTAALALAQRATRGVFDDNELRKYVTTLSRLGLSLADQQRALDAVAKLTLTTGESGDAVFSKVRDAITGSKDALKDYGIVLTGTVPALDGISSALSGVKLDAQSTAVSRLETAWSNLTDTLKTSAADGFELLLKGGEIIVDGIGDLVGSLFDLQVGFDATAAAAVRMSIEFRDAESAARSLQAASTAAAVSRVQSAADLMARAQQARGVTLVGSKLDLTVESAPRRGGGGRRKAPSEAKVEEPDIAGALAATVGGQGAAVLADMERRAALRTAELAIAGEIAQAAERETVASIELVRSIDLRIVALQRELEISKSREESTQGIIDGETAAHRAKMAHLSAERQASQINARAVKESRALQTAQTAQAKEGMLGTIGMVQNVVAGVGTLGALLAKNEKERAAVMAVSAVLDATMAGIRLIADMGVAGIPLAAITIALGVATAVQYANRAGTSKPNVPGGGFAGFQARQISERPDAAGAPMVINVNAPVIGGTAQEIGSALGRYANTSGVRADAA